MDPKNIDTQHLTITGAHKKIDLNDEQKLHLEVKDEVLIIVTQAYGPTGENLVGVSDVTFDGYPALTVGVRYDGGKETHVHLSPFHGDRRKKGGGDEIEVGTKCELFCPVSGKLLDRLDTGKRTKDGADYFAIYLSKRLNEGEMVAISDIWGDYHSRIVDHFELISAWATQEESLEGASS